MTMQDKKLKIEKIISYILKLLTGVDEGNKYVAYSKTVDTNKKITIIDSGFFDDDIYLRKGSMPQFPLNEWHGIPILFGEGKDQNSNNHIIIYADIIASSFFLLSRYEELINVGNFDEHGRFKAEGSVPMMGRFLSRPIIDEYSVQLKKLLVQTGVEDVKGHKGIKIYLTHDVDIPWKKWNIKSAIRTIGSWLIHYKKLQLWPLIQWLGIYKWNPYDTFEWMIALESDVKDKLGEYCEDIYFVIGTKKADALTESYIADKKMFKLMHLLKNSASRIGLHISYNTGKDNSKENIVEEKENLESVSGEKIEVNRYHYLRALGMDSFRNLIKAGITEDFTMGFADYAGFRLGTAQCVNWIDPEELEVTGLKLHPLTVMEGSLSGYMKLNEREAYEYTKALFDKVQNYGGEFTILFHNSSFKIPGCDWMQSFYEKILNYISSEYIKVE